MQNPDQISRLQQRLRTLVEIESPSTSADAVNRAVDQVAAWAALGGARVVRHAQAGFGDVLELWFPAAQPLASSQPFPAAQPLASAQPFPAAQPFTAAHNTAEPHTQKALLLLGHLDTVWPVGTLAQMPWREAPDAEGRMRLWGPGVLDMKAGVVMALEAIACVQARSGGLPRPVCLLLNPDEEAGSPVSRAHTERLAREAEAVFVLEPAQGLPGSPANAAYKTSRKGVGHYRLQVQGVASHAGVDFEQGHSAILELARLLPRVAALTDLSRGITLNPGIIGGGSGANVVAAQAWAEVDLRISRLQDAARIDAALQALRCENPACSLRVIGGLNRPPMERSNATVRLFEKAHTLAAAMGMDLSEAATGGGSDGNFTAALGVPTLDGMGAVGEGAHAAGESVLLDDLPPRIELLARMIATT